MSTEPQSYQDEVFTRAARISAFWPCFWLGVMLFVLKILYVPLLDDVPKLFHGLGPMRTNGHGGSTLELTVPSPSPARTDGIVRLPPNFWNSCASASLHDADWMRSDASAAGTNSAASFCTSESDQTNRRSLTPFPQVHPSGWPFMAQSRMGLSFAWASTTASQKLARHGMAL